MKNIKFVEDGFDTDKLVVEIDLSQEHGLSKSGKTIIVATTEGNQKLHTASGDYYLGLNLYKYPKKK